MVPQGEASFPTWAALFHVVMYHADVSMNHSIQLFGALWFELNRASTLITTVSLTNYYILWSYCWILLRKVTHIASNSLDCQHVLFFFGIHICIYQPNMLILLIYYLQLTERTMLTPFLVIYWSLHLKIDLEFSSLS